MINYTTHTLKEYEQVLKLRRDKIKIKGISQKLNIGCGTINNWLSQNKKPFEGKMRKKIIFPKKISPELSYIFGVLCGDGWIRIGKDCWQIGLDVIDLDFIQEFKCCFDYVFKSNLKIRNRQREIGKKQYHTVFCSKELCDWLIKKSTFKTYDWTIPVEVINGSREIQATFIKGFADSEAYVRLRKGQSEITLTSGNEFGLNQLQNILSDSFDIKSTRNHDRSITYRLNISNYNSLKNFYNKIGFGIRRKHIALHRALDSYKRKGIRRYSEEFKNRALQMLNEGLNPKQISEILQISPANIYDWNRNIIY